jgi:hypothetical protein
MVYCKITLEVVANEDESEVLIQALNHTMDKLEGRITVFSSGISDVETGEPENAAEIAGSGS